jgi:hypothetical protein
MPKLRYPIMIVGVLAVAGCNEALVPDYNNITSFPHATASLQNEFTGAFNRIRNDEGTFVLETEGFARNGAFFTPSEQRWVTQFTGQTRLDNDNFGANTWNTDFNGIKVVDTTQGIIPTLQVNGASLPAATVNALEGVLETTKAMDYMYIAIAHDTNGVPIDEVGKPFTGNLAPILCNKDVWGRIVGMLDSAKAELDAAGPSTTFAIAGTNFTLAFPPGYAALGSTAGGFEAFTLALRARARIEWSFAIARAGAGAPTALGAGTPDQNAQLDSAILDIKASALYSPTLTTAEANMVNDLGVFQSFSAAAGDIANPLVSNNPANPAQIFALEGAVQQIDSLHDLRFQSKFILATGPGSPGSNWSLNATNFTFGSPLPIIRNVELQFLLARAYLGTNQLLLAAQTVDNVRTNVGGLASGLAGVNTADYVSVRDFMMREMIPSLMFDGTGEQIAAVRDYGLIMQDLTTWGAADFHTSMENIPIVEIQQRNGNFKTVCQ